MNTTRRIRPSKLTYLHVIALTLTLLLSLTIASVADELNSPATTPGTRQAGPTDPTRSRDGFTIFMIGDSTMADKPLIPANPERGWGQMLGMYFKDGVRVDNRAVNGRSSKSFRAEGRWQTILRELKPGDYVIIQFGHNDQKKDSPERYAEAFGGFKDNLARYAGETRERGATPILATSVARRKKRCAEPKRCRSDRTGNADAPAARRRIWRSGCVAARSQPISPAAFLPNRATRPKSRTFLHLASPE